MSRLMFKLTFSFFFSVLAGATAQAHISALPQELSVSFVLEDSTVGQTDEVKATFTYTNTSNRAVSVLKWGTALEGRINEDILSISYQGQQLPYVGRIYKRGVPSASDYVSIPAKASLTATVNILDAYSVTQKGEYRVQLSERLMHQNLAISRGALGNRAEVEQVLTLAHDLRLLKQTPVYNSCSSARQTDLSLALDAAEDISKTARDDLAGTPVDQRASAQRYNEWFGNYDVSRWNTVQAHFNSIYTAAASEVITFDCTCTDSFFAYVYPNSPYDIYLCNAFWAASTTGTDSKAGTIVHELSHFTVVADTDDVVYGQVGARNLADSNPSSAINNADSHEYFAENTPALSMPEPVVTPPPPTPTPGGDNVDLLLDIVPILAALTGGAGSTPAAPPVNSALTQVKKLAGRWASVRNSSASSYVFRDYYRFLASSAIVVDADAGISGESHFDGDFDFYLNGAAGIYLNDPVGWVIFDPWGLPETDLGSVHVFTRIASNVNASHFYYYPSSLELSSGIATTASFSKISSSWKSPSLDNTSREESVIQRVADYWREKKRAITLPGQAKSQDLLMAERALKLRRESK